MARITSKRKSKLSDLCFYCEKRVGQGTLLKKTADHIVPRSRGGSNAYYNLVTSCEPCNLKKGNLTYEEFLRKEYEEKYGAFNENYRSV